jgi:hypothetical protein
VIAVAVAMSQPTLSSVATRFRGCITPVVSTNQEPSQREFRRPLFRALSLVSMDVKFGHDKDPIGVSPLFRSCPDTLSEVIPIGSGQATTIAESNAG